MGDAEAQEDELEDGDGGEGSDSDDSEMDLDMTLDMMGMSVEQREEINKTGKTYGLGKEDFIKYLAVDMEEAEALRHAKEKEEEKAMYSVRPNCSDSLLRHQLRTIKTCFQHTFRSSLGIFFS